MPPKDDNLTGYAKELKKQDKYPLKPRTPWAKREPNREHPVATAFLVIPNYLGDQGMVRPLDAAHARHSISIEIVDVNTNAAVTTPVVGHIYALRCQVINRGTVGSYAGIAEFYVATPAVLDALASGGPRPAPLGYAGVIVPPGGRATATCQHHWTVVDMNSGILVRLYDPIVDKPQFPYDSAADRHVARRDIIPDFSGTYLGTEYFAQTPATGGYQLKIVIQQVNSVATISVYSQVSGGLPSVPQLHGTAAVTGSSFVFNMTENLNGQPFTSNVMTFSLTNPNLLHYTMHRHFLMPGDTRVDQDLVADLPRV